MARSVIIYVLIYRERLALTGGKYLPGNTPMHPDTSNPLAWLPENVRAQKVAIAYLQAATLTVCRDYSRLLGC